MFAPYWSRRVEWQLAEREDHLSPQSCGIVPERATAFITLEMGDWEKSSVITMTDVPDELRGLGQ